MSLTAKTRLGPYEITSALGAGGMGEVYRACDPRLGRDVAIKVMSGVMSRDRNPVTLRRFEQEAHAAAALSHPNILSIFDVGVGVGETPFLVTELLELQPESMGARWPQTIALLIAGKYEEAIALGEQVLARSRAPIYVGVLGMAYGCAGRDRRRQASAARAR